MKVATTTREREHEAREAKLEHIREQVSSGRLVISKMTDAQRTKWAKQRGVIEASWTPSEHARQKAALRNMRVRAERLS